MTVRQRLLGHGSNRLSILEGSSGLRPVMSDPRSHDEIDWIIILTSVRRLSGHVRDYSQFTT